MPLLILIIFIKILFVQFHTGNLLKRGISTIITDKIKMKHFTKLLLLLISVTVNTNAQQSIANGNFENWTPVTYQYPEYYPYNSNLGAYKNQIPFNCIQTADAYHGAYAVQLTTISSSTDGVAYFTNSNLVSPTSSNWHGGFPYNEKPTGIRGYYKSAIQPGDSAFIFISFSQGGNNIGSFFKKFYGTQSTYTLFTMSFTLPVTPDSVIFGAASSDAFNNIAIAGSMIQLDSISLTGVVNQPVLFNGDFELWQNRTIKQPDDWYAQLYSDTTLKIAQTTNAYKGNYAVKLITTLDDYGSGPRASSARIGTGDFDQNGFYGGSPFSNKIDTLTFWYKYSPSANDSGSVELFFSNNGSTFSNVPPISLGAASAYQYVEVPFEIPVWQPTPDTVLVLFHSSLWQDSAVIYVGSELIIDEVTFKSQPLTTGISNLLSQKNIHIFPNPATNWIIANIDNKDHEEFTLNIYTTMGELVQSAYLKQNQLEINIAGLSNGLYVIEVISGEKSMKQKLIIHR